LAGGVTALQLIAMALDEDAVAVRPIGAEGAVLHEAAAVVVAPAWEDAVELPSASTASTM